MPPPNHQTGALSGALATKQRTFMCTVGQYGLRGWSTSDTPIASKLRPANSGRWAVAEAGMALPMTWEKLTPPRSKKVPSSMTRVCPPPPSARSQASLWKALPSNASHRATISVCKPTSQFLTVLISMSVFARERMVTDVATELAAFEMNLVDDFVGTGLSAAYAVAERRHAQDPAAGSDHFTGWAERGTGVKDVGVRIFLVGQAGDDVSFARLFRITMSSYHDAKGETAVPFGLDLVETALKRGLDQVGQIALEAQQDRLGLRIAQTAIEFHHARLPLGIDHQAGI